MKMKKILERYNLSLLMQNICMAKKLLLWVFIFSLPMFLAGCGNSYRYYSFKARAEEALKEKKYDRAKELYAVIYQNETRAKKVDNERICWAFYRLGVINELLGEIRLAKGYYWGDSVEEGFYAGDSQIEWLAETGWVWLDQGNPQRTLQEILDLEKQRRPAKKLAQVKQKREIKAPKRAFKPFPTSFPRQNPLPGDQPVRIFNRSLTPPPSSFPEPFRVFY